MTLHDYRVLVRGKFTGLEDAQRAALIAAADEHDVLNSAAFTPEGTLTYTAPALASFTFRVLVSVSPDGGTREAQREAVRRAAALLDADGYGYRDMTADATDMNEIKVRRRARG